MNHFPNPIRCTMALPDDINPADIDWSPVNAVETAAAPHCGRVVRPAERGRGKAKHTHVRPYTKARRPKTHSRSMASDKQQARCPDSGPARQVSGSEARLDTPRLGGAPDFFAMGLRKTARPVLRVHSRYAPQMEFIDTESSRKETETETE
jgi:hypothetical protein